jgi:hypothetical protein
LQCPCHRGCSNTATAAVATVTTRPFSFSFFFFFHFFKNKFKYFFSFLLFFPSFLAGVTCSQQAVKFPTMTAQQHYCRGSSFKSGIGGSIGNTSWVNLQ